MTIEDRLRAWKIPVGMRTIKTTIAVILALLVVQPYGTSTAKVVFATIGAMSAVGPTFKASAVACLTQICSVTVGAVMAVIMAELKVPPMAAVGIGIIILLWMYQYSHLKLLPVLPCLVLVNICLTPEIEAAPYALGRLWDTAIGLGIGMLINTLVFPYDNSQKIRQTMVSLDSDLIEFLEDMFDGDEHQPEAKNIGRKIAALEGQLKLFADQRLFRRKRQKRELQTLRTCEDIAHELLIELETLQNMKRKGNLNEENRQSLQELGAKLSQTYHQRPESVEAVVVNYHVARALQLRKDLKAELSGRAERKRGKM